MKPIHWSALRWMAKSPAHYRYYLDNPLEPTAAMRVGAMAHKLILGGPRQFVIYDGTRRGKAWEEFQAENGDLEIVSQREYDTASAAADAVFACDHAAAALYAGETEIPLRWKIGDRDCSGMADALSPAYLADLKITNDAMPLRLEYHARRMGWLGQLAWYYDGLETKPERVAIVAVEPKPPYPVTLGILSDRALEYGRRMWRALYEQLLVCEASDSWPAYTQTACYIDVPDDESLTLTVNGEEIEL